MPMQPFDQPVHAFKRRLASQASRLAVACLSLLGAASITAETPGNEALAEQYKRAEWVSRVRIEGVGSLIQPSLSRPQMVAVQAYRYTASVVQGWKGGQSGTIKFQVTLSDCHRRLEVDREYIIFGATNYRGGLQSRGCTDLINMEEAGELPKVLNHYANSAG